MSRRKWQIWCGIGLLSASAVLSGAAAANTVIGSSSTSGTSQDGAVSASATFEYVNATTLLVTLVNTLSPVNASTLNGLSQLLSEISFSIAGASFVGPTTQGNAGTGGTNLVTVSGAGVVNTNPGGSGNAWTYGLNNGSFGVPLGQPTPVGFLLSTLVGSNKSLITPTIGAGNTFCASSCDGISGGNGQPFYNGSAAFSLALTGLTDTSVVSNVRFGFGTQPSGSSGGEPDLPGVPIPAAVWLFGSGLLGLIGIARRRQSGNAQSGNTMAPAAVA